MIKVDNFDELIVVLLRDGQVRIPHGSINASQPGVWASRETTNILIVDLGAPANALFNWQNDIVDGSGRAIREYRRDQVVWAAQQDDEPENRQEWPHSLTQKLPFHQVAAAHP